MTTAETERNKATARHFSDGMNTNDPEIISRTIAKTVLPPGLGLIDPLHRMAKTTNLSRTDGIDLFWLNNFAAEKVTSLSPMPSTGTA